MGMGRIAKLVRQSPARFKLADTGLVGLPGKRQGLQGLGLLMQAL